MFEFMFFDDELRQNFMDFAHEQGVPCHAVEDNMGMIATVPEDIPDAVSDALDSYYDELMEQQAERVDRAEGEATHQMAGIRVTLQNGQPCMIRLEPELANRLLSAFTLEEMQTLVQAIARNLENPDDGPVCKRESSSDKA